jgi:RNA polymerase sigma factor (sigma-70 family)
MARPVSGSVAQQIETLFDGGSVPGLSDRQLLDRFNDRRDPAGEAAFAALVSRHGPMVLGICRQLLGDLHHAEDAFQAVFLVLARKARSIRDPDLLGAWLHGVALRTARKARVRLARRRRHEEGGSMMTPGSGSSVSADEPALDREQAEALHREIDRLPSSFRLPVVLCYFDGLTLDEAARRLSWPAGTVRSRLARARDKLRRGLTRRGVALPAATIAAALGPRAASAAVSSQLRDRTTRAAIRFAASTAAGEAVSTSVAALARAVLRSMLLHELRLMTMTVLSLAAVVTGAGFLGQTAATRDAQKPSPVDARSLAAASPKDARPAPAPGRMFVAGRVLDPQGTPVPGAVVMVYARLKQSERPVLFEFSGDSATSQGRCDGSGRFQLDAPRTSSSRYEVLGITAMAAGYGIGWIELDPDAESPSAEISLQPEQVIRGRLFDVQGRPAGDVKITVSGISRPVNGRLEMLRFQRSHTDALAPWPDPVATDAEGRFTLRGLGRHLSVVLSVDDPRFASWITQVETEGAVATSPFGISMPTVKINTGPDSKPLTIALEPAQIITGRVTYADTGKPVPHAPLAVSSIARGRGGSRNTHFRADGEGRFRINPSPGDRFTLQTQSPDDQPYLIASKRIDWPRGAVEQSVDLALPRGVVVNGKVTEERSGKPISGAIVRFTPYRTDTSRENVSGPSTTRSDGSFRGVAPPGPGYLVIQGPSDEYVLREMGSRGGMYFAQPGSRRFYAHAYTFLDLKPGSTGLEVNAMLRRGATIQGRVIGPDDRPVKSASIFSRAILMTSPSGGWKIWSARDRGTVTEGRFVIHGLDRDTVVPVYFLDPEHELGATVNLSGNSAASGLVTVRLERCGTARARPVGPDGKAVDRARLRMTTVMVVTPGPTLDLRQHKEGRLFANEARLAAIDPIHYPSGPMFDALGRVVFPALIPGATYRIIDETTSRDQNVAQIRKDFTVKPGETLDLGDIVIEKPR